MEAPREWIESAEAACTRGQELRDLGHDVWTRDLSQHEAAILTAAADTGAIRLRTAPGLEYPMILVEDRPVFPPSAPYFMSLHWDAFQTLCFRGVITPNGDGEFTLDEPALDKARRLRLRSVP